MAKTRHHRVKTEEYILLEETSFYYPNWEKIGVYLRQLEEDEKWVITSKGGMMSLNKLQGWSMANMDFIWKFDTKEDALAHAKKLWSYNVGDQVFITWSKLKGVVAKAPYKDKMGHLYIDMLHSGRKNQVRIDHIQKWIEYPLEEGKDFMKLKDLSQEQQDKVREHYPEKNIPKRAIGNRVHQVVYKFSSWNKKHIFNETD